MALYGLRERTAMKIKFSHLYEKMPPDFQVSRLVDIGIVQLESLTTDFIEKDTAIQGGGHYQLPEKGKYMILWLESSVMNIRWQTIRRWTVEKDNYYRKHIGELIECEVVK